MEIQKNKTTQYTTFKTDIIKVVLVFSISSFFVNKNSQGRKLSAKKVPTCGISALSYTHGLHTTILRHTPPINLHLVFWFWKLSFVSNPLTNQGWIEPKKIIVIQKNQFVNLKIFRLDETLHMYLFEVTTTKNLG